MPALASSLKTNFLRAMMNTHRITHGEFQVVRTPVFMTFGNLLANARLYSCLSRLHPPLRSVSCTEQKVPQSEQLARADVLPC